MRRILVVAVLALVGGGCAGSPDKATDGDREIVHQDVQASALVIAEADLALAVLAKSPADVAVAVRHLNLIKQVTGDIHANASQLQENFGPPKEPKDYSAAASKASREKAKKEHSKAGFWTAVGAGLVAIGTIAWGVIRKTTLLGQAIDTLTGAGVDLKNRAASGTLTAEEVKAHYAKLVALAPDPVKAKIEASLTKVKKKAAEAVAKVV